MTALELARAKNEARAEIEALAKSRSEKIAMERGMLILADFLDREL